MNQTNNTALQQQSAAPALTALRCATAAAHRALEQGLHIGAPQAGRGDYQRYVEAMWAWLSGFEGRLWGARWPATLEAARRDGKRDWLHADLAAAGLDAAAIDALPRWRGRLPLNSAATRFGVAYVVEGAQLGGQLLQRRLGERLAPWPARWLRGYGADTGTLWRCYLDNLENTVNSNTARRAAADAARQTFDSLGDWLAARGAA